jgi:hypothetical protein
MKSKKNNVRNIGLYFLVSAFVLIIISLFITQSMQDMQPAFREETTVLQPAAGPTLNAKEALSCPWEAEDVTAQQIERALLYSQGASIAMILQNIQANIQYSRNKAAVLFYLAFAYEQTGDTAKAVALYRQLRNEYVNQHSSVYIFNSPRTPARYRIYSVSLYEETRFREFLLTGEDSLLETIAESASTFGAPGAEGFPYREYLSETKSLKNVSPNPGALPVTAKQYLRIASAASVINTVINCSGSDKPAAALSVYLTGQAAALAENGNLGPKLEPLRTSPLPDLTYSGLRKSGFVYYYVFSVPQGITFEVLDNGKNLLVSQIK